MLLSLNSVKPFRENSSVAGGVSNISALVEGNGSFYSVVLWPSPLRYDSSDLF